ncbi:MAG: DEAD/DEAH box helicase [Deltaproteobacteria bacterium]|nr:DEAD/DEAH box helicase [Deltaproteobacteria bacterium]MBW2499714.1 DEAD/DEAH box helicase [Deltaproteobacteria bacterium]
MSSAFARSRPNSGFGDLQLSTAVVNALEDSGYRTPRLIQCETIPACLSGRDVIGLAHTGTGKTAAFAAPILHRLASEGFRGTRVLILVPTRELATQIEREITVLARYTDVSTLRIFGGVPVGPQLRQLEARPDIVVGCPGRVLDLLRRGPMDVSNVDTLVLDEADQMFDMGFRRDLERILAKLPKRRQNLLFSATMPREIRDLANELLSDPHVVDLASTSPNERIEHFLYAVPEERKDDLLNRVLSEDDCTTAIVFMRTKYRAKRTAQQLEERGRRAVALQGNMSQSQRDRAMAGFREGRFDILVATDIAARGLHVAGVDYVVNFDVPSTPDSYTHRIGRTGRSQASGRACTFVTPNDRAWLRDTERVLGQRIPTRSSTGPRLVPAVRSSSAAVAESGSAAGSSPRGRKRAQK